MKYISEKILNFFTLKNWVCFLIVWNLKKILKNDNSVKIKEKKRKVIFFKIKI